MPKNGINLLLPLPEPIQNHTTTTTTHPPVDQKQQYKIKLNAIKPFQPLKPRHMYFLHGSIPVGVIQNLMQCADKTKTFSIVAEGYSNTIAYITIEFIQVEHLNSLVLIFPMLQLPPANTSSSFMIQMLLKSIFVASKTFYVWTSGKEILQCFVDAQYLPQIYLYNLNITELNKTFKWWYNQTFKHNKKCPVFPSVDQSDSKRCTCLYRPYKDTSDNWKMDMALEFVFNEFIDTTNKDSTTTAIPLDVINREAAANYCSALAKMAMVIELNWTSEQLYQYKRFHQGKELLLFL